MAIAFDRTHWIHSLALLPEFVAQVDDTITRKNAQILVRDWHKSPIDKSVLHLDHEAFVIGVHVVYVHLKIERRSITPWMGPFVAIARCVDCNVFLHSDP